MSTVLENTASARGGLGDRLAFFNGLQTVTNRIHATTHSDEIILDLGQDICNLFGADRLTIYVACDGGKSIVTKVKTGLNAYKDFKLPVADLSVAGYVAVHRRIVNIRDVYDANELAAYSPHPNFLRLIDTRTGYRTRQMLVAPVVDAQTADLVGVVQLINTKSGEPFPPAMEEVSPCCARRSPSRCASACGWLRRSRAGTTPWWRMPSCRRRSWSSRRARRAARTSTSRRSSSTSSR